MEQNWRDQLQSDDPKIRAQAVKKLAASGNHDNLKYLKEIVENDPDPQLREYARKAARHLYSSQAQPAPERRIPSPPDPVSPDPGDSEAAARPSSEDSEKTISKAEAREAESKVQRAFSLHTGGQTKKALKIFAEALDLYPDIEKNPYTRSVASELTGKTAAEALRILKDPSDLNEFIEASHPKGKKPGKKTRPPSPKPEKEHKQGSRSQSGLIQAWLSFFQMTEDFLQEKVEDATTEDTLLSVLVNTIAAVVIFLITGFFQFQQISTLMEDQLPQLGFNLGMVFFFILIGTVIFTPLSFYLGVGLQYLGVRLFGGRGDFGSHVYLLALIQVPATILGGVISLLSFIPVIGIVAGLAGFGLSIYIIILTVRSVKAAHGVSTGQAIGGIIVPPLVLMVIFGCIFMVLGSTIGGMLGQIQ